MKNKDIIIIGTADNLEEPNLGELSLQEYLFKLKDDFTLIGLNNIIDFKEDKYKFFDDYITIDYYTCLYLIRHPQLYDRMYIDKTVKDEANRLNILKEVNKVFSISSDISFSSKDNKLYLDKYNPTVLQCALNFALIKALESGYKKNDINIYLRGIKLESQWGHCDGLYDEREITKPEPLIGKMRKSCYKFKSFMNVLTLNSDTTLEFNYIDPKILLG